MRHCLIILLYLSMAAYTTASHADEGDSYPVLSGVGIALKKTDTGILVGMVVADSPADKSGKIKAGDRIVSIEADDVLTDLRDKTVGDTASLIRGQVGTALKLEIMPQGGNSPVIITLTRQPLKLAGETEVSYRSYIGKKAPDLTLRELATQRESTVSQYAGKIVVLDFWASWCATCYAPVERLQSILKRHPEWRDKVELISVSVDADVEHAIAVVEKRHWDQTTNVSIDFDSLKSCGVNVVPITIIVASDGTIANMAGSHAIDVEKEVGAMLDTTRNADGE